MKRHEAEFGVAKEIYVCWAKNRGFAPGLTDLSTITAHSARHYAQALCREFEFEDDEPTEPEQEQEEPSTFGEANPKDPYRDLCMTWGRRFESGVSKTPPPPPPPSPPGRVVWEDNYEKGRGTTGGGDGASEETKNTE